MGWAEDMNRLRLMVQAAFSILTNGYAYGFLQGKIYQGDLKYACMPGLNCYSCPGATAACPIGALLALLNQRKLTVPFWALGFLFLLFLLSSAGPQNRPKSARCLTASRAAFSEQLQWSAMVLMLGQHRSFCPAQQTR